MSGLPRGTSITVGVTVPHRAGETIQVNCDLMPDPDGIGRKLLERTLALALLGVASPVVGLVAFTTLVSSGRPVIYVDERVGLGGRRFGCYKFRTLRQDPEMLAAYLEKYPDEAQRYQTTRKLRHDPRLTRFGRLLRIWSIDEVPQLWNVARGDMSLVGPRPLSPGEFEAAGTHQRDLVRVRPGLTGLWQVSGRSDVSHRRRRALERIGIRKRSLALDAAIVLRTVSAVARRRGAR